MKAFLARTALMTEDDIIMQLVIILQISPFAQPNLLGNFYVLEVVLHFLGEVVMGGDDSKFYADQILKISEKNDLRTPQYDLTNEVSTQQKLIFNLEELISKHPANRFGDSRKLKRHII